MVGGVKAKFSLQSDFAPSGLRSSSVAAAALTEMYEPASGQESWWTEPGAAAPPGGQGREDETCH